MNEWILLVYPVFLFGYLVLAARWQPKVEPSRTNDGPHRRHQARGLRDD
jgi:hypothetical protein